jgi:hypothetical protein
MLKSFGSLASWCGWGIGVDGAESIKVSGDASAAVGKEKREVNSGKEMFGTLINGLLLSLSSLSDSSGSEDGEDEDDGSLLETGKGSILRRGGYSVLSI